MTKLDDKVRERAQTNMAVRDAMRQVEREQQAPRLRVQRNARDAASRVDEALGVFDALPEHPDFNHFALERKAVANALKSAFNSMVAAYDSPQLDSPQVIEHAAKVGGEKLEWGKRQVAAMRKGLQEAQRDIEKRVEGALQTPQRIAGVVASARDALRTMDPAERERLLESATGDTAQVIRYAIGSAPGFLSGVPEGKHVLMRRELLGLHDPALIALEPAVQQAFAQLAKLEEGMARLVGGVADFSAAKALADLRS